MSTDRAWERYGQDNPYFGVLSDDRYRGESLSDSALQAFFASGDDYIDRALTVIGRHFTGPPRIKALDFGCGVGRLAIPLARRFTSIVGVDVSRSMLEEAQKNAERMEVKNLRLCQTLSELDGERGTYSFINTSIVLQHIDPARGLTFISQMLELLAKSGCGALHMTYAREKYHASLGARPPISRVIQALRRPLSGIHRRFTGRDPEMQMNAYPLNKVVFLLQSAGIKQVHAEFTNHGGHLGLVLYFSKP